MSWLVVGAGISGIAAARLLAHRGEAVILSDAKPLPAASAKSLQESGITVITAPQTPALLDQYRIHALVPSPGIPPSQPLVAAALAKGLRIYSDIDLALQPFCGRVIAVTGTNGKSTTVKMIEHAINHSSTVSAIACGNIGLSPATLLLEDKHADVWVLELSSYQLEYSQPIEADGVVFTSFSADHLARHSTEAAYFQAKWQLVKANWTRTPLWADSSFIAAAKRFHMRWPPQQPTPIPSFEQITADVAAAVPHLVTQHDAINAWTAAQVAAHVTGQSINECLVSLAAFKTLPHRFEVIGTLNGFPVINDSKATNVDATCRTLASLTTPCTLLLGGQAKGESFAPILRYSDRINRIIAFGQAAKAIQHDLQSHLAMHSYDKLKDVYDRLDERWFDGPFVLSPACASFDEYKNFEDRGDQFKRALLDWIDRPRSAD